MKPLALISSKDPDFFLVFGHILSVAGFETRLITADKEIARVIKAAAPLAVILDCQPGDGKIAKQCLSLKSSEATGGIPIAALVAPRSGKLQLELIKAGVDEIFSRPFAPEQLLTWLHGKAGLAKLSRETDSGDVVHGDFRLERQTHRTFFKQNEIVMPPIEFKLLRSLLAKPGKVFSREELVATAWPEHAAATDVRGVDVHIARLRKRLRASVGSDVIRTVRSAGYAFAPEW
ncbi:response regulator transcription factor [Mesorhizobium sp. B3-2-1]|uniref:winged helix-turn-helix transcriptional regulator n=1 Tax=unclassified Mesorhizobium TaxID=325217 RepID=UPI00112AFCF9|nr:MULTISPECIES: response regulator transcription factor [unclassified Mesorhizobium]MBZ9671834.1 response regulator transcription factor [Mesorhizobium sp. ES1-3]MBZ9710679.1 response regulator transcription factor [Mesorhizobium sp. ESP7-2]TPI27760.1 response regulator transcription factor [Mesorhizobium sp. B3-2-1]